MTLDRTRHEYDIEMKRHITHIKKIIAKSQSHAAATMLVVSVSIASTLSLLFTVYYFLRGVIIDGARTLYY